MDALSRVTKGQSGRIFWAFAPLIVILLFGARPAHARDGWPTGSSDRGAIAPKQDAAVTASPSSRCPGMAEVSRLRPRHSFRALLPARVMPREMTVCLYRATVAGGGVFARGTVTNGQVVRRMVRDIRRLPVSPLRHYSCPDDNGSRLLVRARYARSGSILVVGHRSGCPFMYGTQSRRTFTLTAPLRRELERVAKK
jgi:hypothetical protein